MHAADARRNGCNAGARRRFARYLKVRRKFQWGVVLLLVSFLAQAVQSTDLAGARKPPEPLVITAPPWRSRATGEDVGRVYPRDALRKGVEARATVECRVAADGRMSDCVVVAVEPAGFGFEEAALKLTRRFRMHLTTPDGASVVGGTIRMPLRFSLPR